MDNSEKIYFEELQVRRDDDYFVTYRPPFPPFEFASLSLTFLKVPAKATIMDLLEKEFKIWIDRYPIPIMANAFDETDAMIPLSDKLFEGVLVGWIDPSIKKAVTSWKLDDLTVFQKTHPLPPNLREIFSDVPFKTGRERQAAATQSLKKTRQTVRATKVIVIFWFVVVPLGVALFEFFGPGWLGTVVLLYAFCQAYNEWRKLAGKRKPTKKETEESEKKSKMEHYYYHCSRNPKGFARLMVENLEEDARNRTKAEAEKLKTIPL
jgi:hypothetical protein